MKGDHCCVSEHCELWLWLGEDMKLDIYVVLSLTGLPL